MKRTLIDGCSTWICAASSTPFIPGRTMSLRSRSNGGSCASSSSAVSESSAATTSYPPPPITRMSTPRTTSESSTIRILACRSGTGVRIRDREVDAERAPLAELRRHRDVAVALLDDAVDARQAEPGALADTLGRVEGLEDAFLDLGRHAVSRVGDRQRKVAAGLDLGRGGEPIRADCALVGLDRQDAAAVHRVARVQREIEQDLLNLRGVRKEGRERRVELGDDRDLLS